MLTQRRLAACAATITLATSTVLLRAEAPPSVTGPWAVAGRVTHADGRPFEGATVVVQSGLGTLFTTGSAQTDAEGRYRIKFAPGMRIFSDHWHLAAVVSVHAPGYYEQNLCRHGDLGMASDPSNVPKIWQATVVLPGEEAEVDFVLLRAHTLRGRLLDAAGKPLAQRRLSLTGSHLPPASSILATTQTNADGAFEFPDVPGFDYFLTLFRTTAMDEVALLRLPGRTPKHGQVEIRFDEQSTEKWSVTVEWMGGK
ncbi:MAG: carboxypeptidase-like regulatory domain-containing protein [Pirellulales bacterium]|nr:carboxypeptidase-like regulatory domain-containing protein [Pirellulales bacterium]